MKRLHPDKMDKSTHKCKVCGLKFIKKYWLDKHMAAKHQNSVPKIHECDFDGKIFKTIGNLRSHMASHVSTINCHICGSIQLPIYMSRHIKEVHTIDNNFHCSFCPKNVKGITSLRVRERAHNKKFECQI